MAFDEDEKDPFTAANEAEGIEEEEDDVQYSEEAIASATIGMTELEKEQYIADLEERKQRQKERALIKQKLQESRAQSDKRTTQKRKTGTVRFLHVRERHD